MASCDCGHDDSEHTAPPSHGCAYCCCGTFVEAAKRGSEIELLRKDASDLSAQRDILKGKLLATEHALKGARENAEAAVQAKCGAEKAYRDLKARLRGRAAYLKALDTLSTAAADLVKVWEALPQGEPNMGGHPEYVDTYEGFAAEMAEWAREQREEWATDLLDDDAE